MTPVSTLLWSLSARRAYTREIAPRRVLWRTAANEFSSELVHARPDRFGDFACLPLPDVDASLEELSHALDILNLDGVVLFTNSNGVYLGDSALGPVFEELERRKTVVYVHRKTMFPMMCDQLPCINIAVRMLIQ